MDVVPNASQYRVLRVLQRRPFKVSLEQTSDGRALFLSTSADALLLEGHPSALLDQISVSSAKVTVGPLQGSDKDVLVVKLYADDLDGPNRGTERAQYLIRRSADIGGTTAASRRRKLGVACSLPGRAAIQITKRSPLAFRVVPDDTSGSAPDVAFQYEMTNPKVIPRSQSCTIRGPARGEDASAFEYQANLHLANMLSMKGEYLRAGRTRLRLVHMRPRAANAEDVALLAIQEMSLFFDGGCSFASPDGSPLDIPASIAPLLAAYDDYLAMFPRGKRAANVLYLKASWLSGCRHYQEAADLYGTIVETYPKEELASVARDRRKKELENARKQLVPPGPTGPRGADRGLPPDAGAPASPPRR